jgi:hypothetical protein
MADPNRPTKGGLMRGVRVEVVIDAGGSTQTYEIKATRAGRRVDILTGRVSSKSPS